jgi:hypothetical protein
MPSKKQRAKVKKLMTKDEKKELKKTKAVQQLIREYIEAASKRKDITVEKLQEEVLEIWDMQIKLETLQEREEIKEEALLKEGGLALFQKDEQVLGWQQEDSETCNNSNIEIEYKKGDVPMDDICLKF